MKDESIFPLAETVRKLFGSREAFCYSFMRAVEGVSGLPVTYDHNDVDEFVDKAIAYCRYLIESKAVSVNLQTEEVLKKLENDKTITWSKCIGMKVF